MSKMPLIEWDRNVSPHLQFIEAGCDMAIRHARSLPLKPAFETKAESELVRARKVLEAALANIIAAQATYHAKPEDRDAA